MNDQHRLDQLHALIARLERQPASPDRDWMLREIRARAVDVETGERPTPVRPRNPDAVAPPAEAVPDRAKPRGTRPQPPAIAPIPAPAPAPAPIVEPRSRADAGRDGRIDLLEQGGVLCLGEPPAAMPERTGRVVSPPWARGLRG
jgi:hypothetical protein